MGNKKVCSCGYWNRAQQECLYRGLGCAKDEQNKKETKIIVGDIPKNYWEKVLKISTNKEEQEEIKEIIKEYERQEKQVNNSVAQV